MQKELSRHASWQELLAAPAPASHILQIYDTDAFLTSSVAHFTAEGLKRGEAVVLSGTADHLQAVRSALAANDVEYEAAQRNARLTMFDLRAQLAFALHDGRLDPVRFEGVAGAALARAASDERCNGVRWWGEITSFLCQQGDVAGGLAAEDLGAEAAEQRGVTVFCSFLCDRFDPRGYGGLLRQVCSKHSHVIPAEDYVGHRIAVNRAIAEVMGEIRGPLLQSLLTWRGLSCDLPSSQALLFWMQEACPDHFDRVLERVKAYQPDA